MAKFYGKRHSQVPGWWGRRIARVGSYGAISSQQRLFPQLGAVGKELRHAARLHHWLIGRWA